MDKPSDTVEASSSKADSRSSVSDPAQLVWEINGQYHVQCSEDEDSCDTTNDKSEEGKMNILPDPHLEDTNSDCNKASEAASDGVNESTSQARQRSRRDWQLLKWQTRQVAKAFVDNTINRVLEDMGFVPLSADTEDIINDGNLEHEAVSMAILSHGLQRSDHDTATTSTHVDSKNSHSTYINNKSSFHFIDGLSTLTKVKNAHESYLPNNQTGASCSFSSPNPQFQTKNLDVSSDVATSDDRIIVSAESVMTGEHSETHVIVQAHSSSFSSGDIFKQPQADSEVPLDSTEGSSDKLQVKSCACSLSHNLPSYQEESTLAPLHKRKAEDFPENTKRCCHDSSSLPVLPDANHTLPTGSMEESVSILYDKVPSFEHFDFMDAAVAVAIQKKGLSAMACTEYG